MQLMGLPTEFFSTDDSNAAKSGRHLRSPKRREGSYGGCHEEEEEQEDEEEEEEEQEEEEDGEEEEEEEVCTSEAQVDGNAGGSCGGSSSKIQEMEDAGEGDGDGDGVRSLIIPRLKASAGTLMR